ncbi:hypothetical protein DFH09DRAFT_1079263 [Mycena vulgaris]|nr:hypothetical protein DFH09DRAFT_1079263 [Mycena vulgaris]
MDVWHWCLGGNHAPALFGIVGKLISRLIWRTRILRVNGRLRGPVYGLTRTVTVSLEVEPTSPTVRGRTRFYVPYFRKNTGRFDAGCSWSGLEPVLISWHSGGRCRGGTAPGGRYGGTLPRGGYGKMWQNGLARVRRRSIANIIPGGSTWGRVNFTLVKGCQGPSCAAVGIPLCIGDISISSSRDILMFAGPLLVNNPHLLTEPKPEKRDEFLIYILHSTKACGPVRKPVIHESYRRAARRRRPLHRSCSPVAPSSPPLSGALPSRLALAAAPGSSLRNSSPGPAEDTAAGPGGGVRWRSGGEWLCACGCRHGAGGGPDVAWTEARTRWRISAGRAQATGQAGQTTRVVGATGWGPHTAQT